MRDGTAPRVVVPYRRHLEVVYLRVVSDRDSGRHRWRRRLRRLASHERFGESLLVAITLVLVGVLLASVDHALDASRLSAAYASSIASH